MRDNQSDKKVTDLVSKMKIQWQSRTDERLEFSEQARRSLFLKLREIDASTKSSIPWDLSAYYFPRLSFASAFAAILCFVTFQFSGGDLVNISLNEQVESDGSDLIAGGELDDDVDSSDLLIDEQQDEEV